MARHFGLLIGRDHPDRHVRRGRLSPRHERRLKAFIWVVFLAAIVYAAAQLALLQSGHFAELEETPCAAVPTPAPSS